MRTSRVMLKKDIGIGRGALFGQTGDFRNEKPSLSHGRKKCFSKLDKKQVLSN